MLIIPAIDILEKRLVRLTQGDYTRVTEYNLSPLEALKDYARAGAKRVHLIFLDAAREGFHKKEEIPLLKEILTEKKRLGIEIELGGGIRTLEDVHQLIDLGADYVILGTTAILEAIKINEERERFAPTENLFNFLQNFTLSFESTLQGIIRNKITDKVIIALDSKRGAVAISGWEATVPQPPESLLALFWELRFRRVIYTSVEQDGTLSGTDQKEIYRLASSIPDIKFIAAGGIGGYEDIAHLKQFNLSNLEGVILGKALYEKRIDLKEAILRFQ